MQRKLPERQQPPAILLPWLLFSGREICWVCCSGGGNAAPRVIWGGRLLRAGDAPGKAQLALNFGGDLIWNISSISSLMDIDRIPGVVAPCGMGLMLLIHLLLLFLQVRINSLCWIHCAVTAMIVPKILQDILGWCV